MRCSDGFVKCEHSLAPSKSRSRQGDSKRYPVTDYSVQCLSFTTGVLNLQAEKYLEYFNFFTRELEIIGFL